MNLDPKNPVITHLNLTDLKCMSWTERFAGCPLCGDGLEHRHYRIRIFVCFFLFSITAGWEERGAAWSQALARRQGLGLGGEPRTGGR